MTPQEIQKLVDSHKVVIFGKGSKGIPRCGFTAQVQAVFEELFPEYEAVDVLQDLRFWRTVMEEFSDWPTFPQVYVNGEFIGGCDITLEMHESGELQKMFA
jgi:monothiol glutaredoxin